MHVIFLANTYFLFSARQHKLIPRWAYK